MAGCKGTVSQQSTQVPFVLNALTEYYCFAGSQVKVICIASFSGIASWE
jgi:hypothetical protein